MSKVLLLSATLAILVSSLLAAQVCELGDGERIDAATFAWGNQNAREKLGSDSIKGWIETVFEWKVQEGDSGYLLINDHPYESFSKPVDYAILNVLKSKGKARPDLLSFAFGKTIDFDRHLSLTFAKWRGTSSTEVDKSAVSFHDIPFTSKNSSHVKLTLPELYVDRKQTQDLFLAMNKNDFMTVEVFGLDGKEYRIVFPLLFFRDALATLD